MDLCDKLKKKDSPVMYRRRLDRTADTNFQKLTENDKIRIVKFRSALEEAKSRIGKLRDEGDHKDYIIQQERELRKATEDSLQKYLVDIYKNPDVNLELSHRLPHAKKTCCLHHKPEVTTDDSHLTTSNEDPNTFRQNEVTTFMERVGNRSGMFEPASDMEMEKSTAYRRDVSSKDSLLSQQLADTTGGNREALLGQTQQNKYQHQQPQRTREQEPWTTESNLTSRHVEDPYKSSVLETSQDPELWTTLKSVYQFLPPYINPNVYTNPLSPVSWSSLESSVYQGLPQSRGHQYQESQEHESRYEKDENQQTLFSTGTQTSPQNIQAPNRFFNSAHSASLPSLHHVGNPGPSQPSVSFQPSGLPTHYLPDSTSKHGSTPLWGDNISHTSRLLVEIATLKKENQELREKLREAALKMEVVSGTKSMEDENLNKIGAMIEELYSAEKKRSIAAEKLMGAADKGKAETPDEETHLKKKHTSKSVQVAAISDSEFSEVELYEDGPVSTSESITESTDSTKKMLDKQKYIEQLVTRQREIMKEEMQKVLDERNEARQRVMKLEKKLASLELSHLTDNRSSVLLAKLRVTERERDLAVSRLQHLVQDVSETKLVYNLHKALLYDDPTNYTSTYSEFKLSNLDIDLAKNPATSILSKETEEKANLVARITLIEKDKQSQARYIDKLEQLVKRQRQKLNTLCAGPMLMEND